MLAQLSGLDSFHESKGQVLLLQVKIQLGSLLLHLNEFAQVNLRKGQIILFKVRCLVEGLPPQVQLTRPKLSLRFLYFQSVYSTSILINQEQEKVRLDLISPHAQITCWKIYLNQKTSMKMMISYPSQTLYQTEIPKDQTFNQQDLLTNLHLIILEALLLLLLYLPLSS